ncbi:MAG TPA: GNAT family N-acetyltransferase [Stellaceae bacterium]|nr:GNAT family N-acetyltransferase [Stellaceae bacterium]
MAELRHGAAVETARLPDGTAIRLRDIAPGDEGLLQELLRRMSPDDVRLRFFAPIRELSPALAFRLSHPDPGREIAIAALPETGADFLGVARLFADETRRRGEYALAVRTDMKGRGIGYLLLGRVLARAKAMGMTEAWGDVLRENETMLQMAREHGFTIEDHPEDAALARVRKRL